MKTKRLLACILAITMLLTMLPSVAMAEQSGEPTEIASDTKENTNQAGGIIYTKTSTAKSDGTVDITLTAHTTGVVKQMSSVSPTDIVLVIDVSGSMETTYDSSSVIAYNEVLGNSYTYRAGLISRRTGYGFNSNSSYYINTGTAETPVYTRVSRTGRDGNGYEYFEYTGGTNEVYVYPVLANGVATDRANTYPVYQFYAQSTTTTTRSRMDVLKNAVNAFIDTTATMNEGLSADEMHTISVVKFAGPSYSNDTTDTPDITVGNGTYTQSNGENSATSNYSQVVAGLTPVDENGKTTLKNAVASLAPAGSTAVDKGLALAEAVLMNRSAVTRNAVDRNEVVIVFTDGEPNHWSGFDSDVADDAIETAYRMKNTADVTIYGVSVDANADETDLDENINKFMHYVSSNYPTATSMSSDENDCDITAGYYMTPDGSKTLTSIFETIIQNIDHPTITMGEEATMVDTLSPYFDFKGDVTTVKLQTSARNADGTWGDPVDDAHLTAVITEDRLIVDGFDFDANYVSETGRGEDGDFYGKRLVVSFTVVPDYDVIDAASATLIDGILPTNMGFASLVDSDSASAADVETPELPTHTVTYKVDGDEYASYSRFTGSTIEVDAVPTKTGYKFSGWKIDGEDYEPGDTFTMPNADVEIIGTFEANTYNVTYQYSTTPPTGAPDAPSASSAQYGDIVTVEPAPVFEGYVFKGWFPLQTDVEVEDGKFTMPAKDVTLVGYFENSTSTPYEVHHYLETLTDGVYEATPEITETFYGTTNNEVTATPLNRFTGFTYNAVRSAETISGKIRADGKLVLEVYYDRNEYTVTYGYDGEAPTGTEALLPTGGTYVYGETVPVADKVTAPDGYTFTGWYRGTVDNPVETEFTMPAYDVHLLGYFTASTGTEYTVEHYLMGTDGQYPEKPEITETFTGTTGHDVTATPLTTFEGFTYNGAISTPSGKIAGDGSLVLELYYDRNKYDVTYRYERTIPDDATPLPATVSYYHGETVDLEANATAKGYTFSGWHVHSEDVEEENGSFVMPKRNVEVYGYFTANTDTRYTVEHYVEKLDGTGYEAEPHTSQTFTGTTGVEVTASAIAITGFTYNDTDSALTKTGTITGDGLLVLKLYYDRNEYKVTYGYEGDTDIDNLPTLPAGGTYIYGAQVPVADKADAPDGYTFTGWYRGTVDNPVETEFTMPAYDVHLLGFFTAESGKVYKVEHYLMGTDGQYEEDPEVTETFTGTTGHTVNATPLNRFTGFTYNEGVSTTSGKIAADGSLILKLYYDRNKYDVIYAYERTIPDDATPLPQTVSYYHGETVDFAAAATAKGYTFSGWQVHSEDVEADNGSFEMPERNVEIYGYFTANTDTKYTVEHYVEKLDGTGYETEPHTSQTFTGTTGVEVTASAIAITGFTYNDTVGTKTGTITGDGLLVLKLYYDRNEYKVTYEYEGDTDIGTLPPLPTQETFAYGAHVTVAGRVTAPAGYTFVGWYRGEVTNIVTEFTMPDRDVVLRGYYSPGENTPYTIEHYLETLTDGVYEEDPEVTETFTGTTGHTVNATPLNRFTGFTYNEGVSTPSGKINGKGTTVLKLYYDREQYNVTYGYDGDVPSGADPAPAGGTYAYGADVTVADKVEAPDGYTFVGWYRGTQDNPVSGTFEMPDYDVHILGNFEEETNTPYRVEHYLQTKDGTGYELDGTGETRHGKTNDTVTAFPKEYPGFTYNEGKSTASGKIKGDGTLTLRFYYDRHTHGVTYVYDSIAPQGAPAVPSALENVYYGTEITVASAPKVPGYTFSGWTTQDADIDAGKFSMPDNDVVFKGGFASNLVDYKVNYWFQKTDAGETFNPADYELDADSYTRTAYVGQYVEADAKAHTGFSVNEEHSKSFGHVTVDANGDGYLVLDIYFDRHVYDVTYGYYGEQPAGAPDLSAKNREKVRYGTVLDVETKPTLDGYSFDGWYTRTATVDNGKFTMPDHDVEFLGRFIAQYTVSYDLNGGTGADGVDYTDKTVNSGTAITVNAAPTRSGYTFKGWVEGDNIFNPDDTLTVDRNITFVAKWSRNGGGGGFVTTRYTLTYETNGGNAIAKETYSEGTNVKLTKVPVKEGYAFEGWYLDEALTENVTEVKMTEDKTVYASWVKDNGGAGHGHRTPDALNGSDHFAYVVGYPDGTVRPNANISRAEVTTIFFRLLKPDEVRDKNLTSDNNFTDVGGESWYNTPISTMAKLGIVNGRTADGFAPDAYITRAEFAAICARFDDSEYEVADNFTDVAGHWAEDYIHEAAAHGWIRGYEDGTFKPDQYITRAEAMTMINRVLNRVPETSADLLDTMIKWPDNSDVTAWYYLPVQEATNSHDYEMKNHVYEKWTVLREVTDWTRYE